MMLVILAVGAAIFQGTDAGVCQDTDITECVSRGCRRSGNSCMQPEACTVSGNPYIYYGNTQTGVRVSRSPVSAAVAELCDADTECSAIYTVELSKEFTTGQTCNDIAMLPPHGVDQTRCSAEELEAEIEVEGQMWRGVTLRNYINHPFPNDGIKQSLAVAQGSVTALTESSVKCKLGSGNVNDGNENCAFPLGYKSDTIVKHLGICVSVVNAQDKWVEIMASSMEGSSGGSFCVRDRAPDANQDGETGCTVSGDLIDIRESGNRPQAGTVAGANDKMSVIFYAQDNTDDAAIDFQWRIAASYIRPTNREPNQAGEEKDAEDWSMSRDGAGYPMSLMSPYPANYNGTPVFETSTGSSASWAAPVLQFVLALVAMTALVL